MNRPTNNTTWVQSDNEEGTPRYNNRSIFFQNDGREFRMNERKDLWAMAKDDYTIELEVYEIDESGLEIFQGYVPELATSLKVASLRALIA